MSGFAHADAAPAQLTLVPRHAIHIIDRQAALEGALDWSKPAGATRHRALVE